ncbi:MAG: hypothetical protein PHQ40_05635 [Anaerolineaceae bacterium]|nr:hypothetical protein [Anaerolineaceae bacterium]
MTQHNNTYSRDRAIDQYVRALDTGDLDGVLAVLQLAQVDAELDRQLMEINQAYAEEIGLSPLSEKAEEIRQLLRTHLPSAFIEPEETDEALTVGEVAASLVGDRTIPEADRELSRRLIDIRVALPEWLGFADIVKLGEQLRIRASERFWDTFRDKAIQIMMGRGQAQMAAARRAKRPEPHASDMTDKSNEHD